jgi:hypothetical protein
MQQVYMAILPCDEMLRAVGRFVQSTAPPEKPILPVRIRWTEPLDYVQLTSPHGEWILSAAEIIAMDLVSRLRHGSPDEHAWFIEPLRVVGTALRAVRPKSAHIEFQSHRLVLRFTSFADASEPIELTYDQTGIAALRRAMIGRRVAPGAAVYALTTGLRPLD